jgi:hypothetical protein
MRPAVLSTENRLKAALADGGMPVRAFVRCARLDGIVISASRLYAAFDDNMMSLDGLEGQRLMRLWGEIVELNNSIAPLHLDLTDGERVYQWLLLKRRHMFVFVVPPDAEAETIEAK